MKTRRTQTRREKIVGALPPSGAVFLTKAQMAALLQVSVRCITDMMKRGELPYLKLRGGFVRFRLDDVHRRFSETALVCPSLQTSTKSTEDAP